MKLRKVMAWTLASAMFAGLLAGCGGSTQTTETAAAESGSEEGGSSAEGGKVLRYQASTLVDSLDPALSNDYTSSGVISQFMMGLMTKDESGAPVYGVAESEEKSEDGLTLTFKIRDDAKWSNGDPVTANDFVYAWRRVADPATASDYQFFITTACIANAEVVTTGEKPVEELGVEAADDKTLVVTLSSPCAIFDYLMASGACFLPLNQKFVESCGGNFATSADTLLADGPFKVSSYEPSAMKVELVKNDQFFGASDVKLDGVEFSIITDSQTAALSFENGDLDVVTLSGNLVEQYEEEAITTRVLKDGSTPMDYFVPQGLATNEKGEDFREAAGSAYDSWTYDVEAAKELWKTGLGELGKDSLSFTLMCEDTDSAQAVAQFLQSEWQNNLPGLTIELQVLPKKARLEYMQKGEYDIGLTRWGPDYADPMTDLDMWITGSSTNYSQFSDADYDATIQSAKKGDLALDQDARWEALVGCEKTLADQCVLFPIYGQSVAVMTNPDVSGIQYYSVGLPYLFINVDKK